MQGVNPIPVGRNASTQEQNPLMAQMQQLQAGAPVAAATVAAPVAPAPVMQPVQEQVQTPVMNTQASIQQNGGCAMYFNVKAVTKIILEMPWGFISNELDCAFISNVGELVVCDLPPMYDETNDVFVLDPVAKSLVLGKVAAEHVAHWRQSVSFRPDSGLTDEDVKKVETVEVTEQPTPAAKPQVLVDTTDYSHLSRNQRKRIKRAKLASGINVEDLPDSLRTA